MPLFELIWNMEGRAVIEADDADEADEILQEGLENLDSSMFDEVNVNDVTTKSCTRVGDDD